MGITLNNYLSRYRVQQAKALLATGDLTVTEVAMKVGFTDSGYFGRVFRREIGVSPSAFQRGER
jgi:two-component system response regulator YesN